MKLRQRLLQGRAGEDSRVHRNGGVHDDVNTAVFVNTHKWYLPSFGTTGSQQDRP